MHLILTGATGLIGTGVLACMLKTKDISKITILSRRPVRFADEVKDPRVNVIIQADFKSYSDPSLQEQLKDARGCVWALGTSSSSNVTEEEYVTSTKDYAVEAAKAFTKLDGNTAEKPFRFVYVSGIGATQNPGRFTALYAKTKGETETALAQLAEESPALMVTAPRPCAVDVAPHEEARKYAPEPMWMHKILRGALMTPIRIAYHKMYASTELLGGVLTQLVSWTLQCKTLQSKPC